jgi:anti-sigma regulatory factor (Ser/Thr protein kinase)
VKTIELNGGPEAVGAARHAIEELADREALPRVEDLRLLVSELVTNSVLHGGAGRDGCVELHVHRPDSCVRVEVCDRGSTWVEQIRSTSLDSEQPAGGWGLMLVSTLADRWGVEVDEGTCVWFELEDQAIGHRP